MPIDVDKALAATLPPVTAEWYVDQVILYHLGLGAGVGRATDPRDLRYTYERDLQVVPTFAGLPLSSALPGLDINSIPGIDVDVRMLLHAEQETIVHQPLAPSGRLTATARVADIWDKGSAAVIVLQTDSVDASGSPVAATRSSLFVRGAGGFGGDKGPSTKPRSADGEPDAVFEIPTLPHQALLYRLSGDKNPLHVDPDMAKIAGFDTPILHGMCTYGAVCKAVIDEMLDGRADAVGRFGARFAGVVYPGETIVVSAWQAGESITLTATTKERDTPVLTNGSVATRVSN